MILDRTGRTRLPDPEYYDFEYLIGAVLYAVALMWVLGLTAWWFGLGVALAAVVICIVLTLLAISLYAKPRSADRELR